MKFPSKVTSYQDSVFPKITIILDTVHNEPMEVIKLFNQTKKKFDNINDFIEVLVILFAIKKINLNKEGVIYYVC
ncbi:ABC-three component system middle component 7 [Facklamia sp. P12950]|uniref:ABC-three component system middle component 7 n=1 Tax=Facklamia sp. P12950 TaxID=3421951 RepID=UPI003D16877A